MAVISSATTIIATSLMWEPHSFLHRADEKRCQLSAKKLY